MTDFVHLHVHSDYSEDNHAGLQSIATIEELVNKAVSLGMKHLALTNNGNMFEALKFKRECEKKGIHPIIGSEFYLIPTSLSDTAIGLKETESWHLILLASNDSGYRNLVKLSSYSWTKGFREIPRIDKETLTRYHEGLIGISVGFSEMKQLSGWLSDLQNILGENNFYLGLSEGYPVAESTGIPIVAINEINCIKHEDMPFLNVVHYTVDWEKQNDQVLIFPENNSAYFKTRDEMAALFPDNPEAVTNTIRIAERCNIVIPQPVPCLPDFDIPEGFSNSDEYLMFLAQKGLNERHYPADKIEEARNRLDYELGVIIKAGFADCFLIVADYVNWAKLQGIRIGPGRAAVASSITAYALGITAIDPFRYHLLFERFINPGRPVMPDFDIDVESDRRDEVVAYIIEKYGNNRVGHIITFETFRSDAGLRDIARAISLDEKESDIIVDLLQDCCYGYWPIDKAIEYEPRLEKLEKDIKYQEFFTLARRLERKNHHTELHAAGLVIAKTDLTDYVPIYRDAKTETIATQYAMDDLEDCGLVKFDILGLTTLSQIKNAEELIRKRGGACAEFSIDAIPLDDPATFKLLKKGDSYGVFQFESKRMQEILKQVKPDCIEDLIALYSLYRPGVIDYIPQLIDSKWEWQPIEYIDPCLEDILKETYGIVVYQEQVMEIVNRIAGYRLGQADILRRAMGRRKPEVLRKEKFLAGALANGFTEKNASRIFEFLLPFAGITFNKSHAAAYALIAYQTAYLKTNFSGEFSKIFK